MARRQTTKNLIKMLDPVSGTELGLYYRLPTTEERQAFLNDAGKRIGEEYVDNSAEARYEGGLKVLTGVRDGDFEREIDKKEFDSLAGRELEGKEFDGLATEFAELNVEIVDGTMYLPISSNPESPLYFEGWKAWMETHCADLIYVLGVRVFEGVARIKSPEKKSLKKS